MTPRSSRRARFRGVLACVLALVVVVATAAAFARSGGAARFFSYPPSSSSSSSSSSIKRPLIVMITPTYARASDASPPQANTLLRLRNAMCAGRRHRFMWVLVSSSSEPSDVHARVPPCSNRHDSAFHALTLTTTPPPPPAPAADAAAASSTPLSMTTRVGWNERNAAIDFLTDDARFFAAVDASGFFPDDASEFDASDPVVYFADDDNEYDPLLFDEIASVRRVGTWPVGFPPRKWRGEDGARVESVVVAGGGGGGAAGFHTVWCGGRTYAMDMASFALRRSVFTERMPNADESGNGNGNETRGVGALRFKGSGRVGALEDEFLSDALGTGGAKSLEVMADGATKVYAWHLFWKGDDAHDDAWGLTGEITQPLAVSCGVGS